MVLNRVLTTNGSCEQPPQELKSRKTVHLKRFCPPTARFVHMGCIKHAGRDLGQLSHSDTDTHR
jgi:hypothetical protein